MFAHLKINSKLGLDKTCLQSNQNMLTGRGKSDQLSPKLDTTNIIYLTRATTQKIRRSNDLHNGMIPNLTGPRRSLARPCTVVKLFWITSMLRREWELQGAENSRSRTCALVMSSSLACSRICLMPNSTPWRALYTVVRSLTTFVPPFGSTQTLTMWTCRTRSSCTHQW